MSDEEEEDAADDAPKAPEEEEEEEASSPGGWPPEAKKEDRRLAEHRTVVNRAMFTPLQTRYQSGVGTRVTNQPTDTGHLYVMAESVLEIFGAWHDGNYAPVTYGNPADLKITTVDEYRAARARTVLFCRYFSTRLRTLYADFAYCEAKVSKFKRGDADVFVSSEAAKLREMAARYGVPSEDWEGLYDVLRRQLIGLIPAMSRVIFDTIAEGNVGGRAGAPWGGGGSNPS